METHTIKKISLLTLLALSSSAYAEGYFFGVEQTLSSTVNNTTNDIETTDNTNISTFKIGGRKGGENSSRWEVAFHPNTKALNPFVQGDKKVFAFGINYNATMEDFSPAQNVLPYVRFGATVHISDDKYISRDDDKEYNYSAVGFSIGLGTYYNVTDKLDISVGYDVGYRLWQDLYYGSQTLESSETFSKFYIGASYALF